MLTELNHQLAALQEMDRVRNKLQAHYELVQKDLAAEQEKCRHLDDLLQKESADVAKLEGMSLQSIFYTLLGSKEQQLDKEKQEQLAAKLKHEESVQTQQDLKQEAQQLQAQLSGYQHLNSDFKAVLAAKEEWLLTEHDEISLQLNSLSEEVSALQGATREVEEAVLAGEQVLYTLEEVVAALQSAQSWGTWDMFGGGMVVTAIKHGHIDEAKKAMHPVQQKLRLFNYELKDVNTYEDLTLELSTFDTFSDYFFDNLITDWMVQSKIDNSLKGAQGLQSQVSQLVDVLRAEAEELQAKQKQLTYEHGLLIQQAGQ